MINSSEVKKMLSLNDIHSLLSDLGGEPKQSTAAIVSKTICHNHSHEGSHKLVYYADSNVFKCYTNCGTMDVFGLVSKIYGFEFYEAFKFVCNKFGIHHQGGFYNEDKIDMSFFNKFKREKESIPIDILDHKIMNSYYDLYHQDWLKDGISSRSMRKFNIKFSIMDNQIIIPHYNEDGDLIGVRGRNLNKELVDEGMKYMPVYWKKQILKHPTGAALYGLNFTKEQIKKHKAAILFESEKSVLQLDSMMPDLSIGACVSGSTLTYSQLEILKSLDIEEVIIALDKEYDEIGSTEEKFYAEKITSIFVNKLSPYFTVSIIWDQTGLLDRKDSPTDKGLEVFKELLENRIYI